MKKDDPEKPFKAVDSVGNFVFFCISTTPLIYRPLLTVKVRDNGQLDGELFLEAQDDWQYEWVQKNLFAQLNAANRIVPLTKVEFGPGLGQYVQDYLQTLEVGNDPDPR